MPAPPEKRLLRLLLDYEFYSENKARLDKALFPAPLDTLFRTIEHSHDKYQRSITIDELEDLYVANNPTATTAAKTNVYELLDEVGKLEPMGKDVGKDILTALWQKEIGRQVAIAGLDLQEGMATDLSVVEELMDRAKNGFAPTDHMEPVNTDLEDLLMFFDDRSCWHFNIPVLREKCPGGAGGEFMIWFGRTNTGKTAGWVSLVAGPDGFCEQGAKVHAFINEEPGERTVMRAYSARTGLTRDQIRDNPALARSRLGNLREQLTVYHNVDLTLTQLDAHCKEHKPDIVIVDQLDKVQAHGTFDRPDLRLAHIYRSAREIAIRNNCFVIAISQASDSATGKTFVTPDMLDNSRTGKAAEADIIVGIGTHVNMGAEEDMTRILNVGKNKITGWHGAVTCVLNKEISRYES